MFQLNEHVCTPLWFSILVMDKSKWLQISSGFGNISTFKWALQDTVQHFCSKM